MAYRMAYGMVYRICCVLLLAIAAFAKEPTCYVAAGLFAIADVMED